MKSSFLNFRHFLLVVFFTLGKFLEDPNILVAQIIGSRLLVFNLSNQRLEFPTTISLLSVQLNKASFDLLGDRLRRRSGYESDRTCWPDLGVPRDRDFSENAETTLAHCTCEGVLLLLPLFNWGQFKLGKGERLGIKCGTEISLALCLPHAHECVALDTLVAGVEESMALDRVFNFFQKYNQTTTRRELRRKTPDHP